jgi:hypothetical protein
VARPTPTRATWTWPAEADAALGADLTRLVAGSLVVSPLVAVVIPVVIVTPGRHVAHVTYS